MANNRCPGCGAVYNGKKCRLCLYTPMETDLSRHSRKSSPSSRPKKKPSAAGSLRDFLIILAVIAITMPLIRNWGVKLDAVEAANRTPESIPGNTAVLYQQDFITLLAPEQADTALWFYNHGKEDILMICKDITINGSPIGEDQIVVELTAGNAVKTRLLEQEHSPEEIAFRLEVYNRSGILILETDPIHWET